MSEQWRVKRYYDKRVLIPIVDMLDNPYPGRLLPLSGAQVNLIRNVLQYARRRTTFVDAYHDNHYLAPDNEQWDSLQEIVDDLEGKLMSDCCEQLLEEFSDLNDVMVQVQAQLACLCTQAKETRTTPTLHPDWVNDLNNDKVWEGGIGDPDVPYSGLELDEACGLAQAWYHSGFEILFEQLMPIWKVGYRLALAAVSLVIVAQTGGVALPILLGAWTLGELIEKLFDLSYESAESNLYNWVVANKDELICAMYEKLQASSGNMRLDWLSIYGELVAGQPELSDGDELFIKWCYGAPACSGAKKAQEVDSAWYQSVVAPGYCAVCPEPPIIGSDWIAYPYYGDNREIHYDDPSPSSTPRVCCTYEIPDGMRLVGVMFEVHDQYGTVYNWDRNPGSGCGGSTHSLCGPLVDDWPPGWWYWHNANGPEHDRIEALNTLHPGATLTSGLDLCTGPLLAGYQIGHPHAAGRIGGFYWTTHYLVYRYP